MKVSCIVQARMGSTRLPGKVLLKLAGRELLLHVVDRLLNADKVDEVIIATTEKNADDAIADMIKTNYGGDDGRVTVFRGSEDDVLDRYYQAAKASGSDVIVRVTSDNPLIDWRVIDVAVKHYLGGEYDYVSNVLPSTYPLGICFEVFGFTLLERLWKTCKEQREREHVTAYVREHQDLFRIKNIENNADLSHMRWTVDEEDDFNFVKRVYDELYHDNPKFITEDILELLERVPEIGDINKHVKQKKVLKTKGIF
jgi:spore coat polysaccharide biosynthesis protein SpsF